MKSVSPVDFGLFAAPAPENTPRIRTRALSAPGSRTSEAAADAVTDPMRARSHRLIINELTAAGCPLSREELSRRTGYKETTLCARLYELRPEWVEAVSGACVAASGLHVDGYQLAARLCAMCGTHRGMKPGKILCGSCSYNPSTDDAA